MEIVHAHTTTKPNSTTMDFQQKTKVHNPLQHRKPSPLKRHVGEDLICDKGIGSQKSMWFEKGGQLSSSLYPIFHFGFL
jgi:hypothetical protein